MAVELSQTELRPWWARAIAWCQRRFARTEPLDAPAARLPKWLVVTTALAVAALYALLWTPNWYVLSDSGLYLCLARSIANGNGFRYMGQAEHLLAQPATPGLLALVMKCGGGIGAMQAVLIVLMLAGHWLCYLTLSRWISRRMALVATVAAAGSYWVFLNAVTIMTEPLFLVLFWGAMLAFSSVPGRSRRSQWILVLSGVALLAGAFENRVAAIAVIPGVAVGLWTLQPGVRWYKRAIWPAILLLIFSCLGAEYYILRPLQAKREEAQRPPSTGPAAWKERGREDADATQPEQYHFDMEYVRKHAVDLPVTGGRWICEGLAAATKAIFDRGHGAVRYVIYIVGIVVAMGALAVCFVGWLSMIRQRQWWIVGLATYFVPIWIHWGTRIKPRYMIPIAPILFLLLWAGLIAVISWRRQQLRQSIAWGLALVLLGLFLLANAQTYALEMVLRRDSAHDFYDRARGGATAELVDICAYIRDHAGPDDRVWVNDDRGGMVPRVVSFMTGRRCEPPIAKQKAKYMHVLQFDGRAVSAPRPTTAPRSATRPTTAATKPATRESTDGLATFIGRIIERDPDARFAIVFNSGPDWPEWHWPLKDFDPPAQGQWWRLYELDPVSREFRPVNVPRSDRSYIREIPTSAY